jgi:hypothetical protein
MRSNAYENVLLPELLSDWRERAAGIPVQLLQFGDRMREQLREQLEYGKIDLVILPEQKMRN